MSPSIHSAHAGLVAALDAGRGGDADARVGEEGEDALLHAALGQGEAGEGEVWIDGVCNRVKADDAAIVPAGARHNVKATGGEPLRLYTIYSPPEHIDGTVHKTCAEAHAAHEHWDGKTTE